MNNGLANRAPLLSKQPRRNQKRRECERRVGGQEEEGGRHGGRRKLVRVSATSFLGTELPSVLETPSATLLPKWGRKSEQRKCFSAVAQMETLFGVNARWSGVLCSIFLQWKEFGMRVGGQVPSLGRRPESH